MIDQEVLQEYAESYLRTLISKTTNLGNSDLDASTPFGELGIDSFYVLKIVKELESDFGKLSKTLLFENFNIHDLAVYFVSKHRQTMIDKFSAGHVTEDSGGDSSNSTRKIPNPTAVSVTDGDLSASTVIEISENDKQAPIILLEKRAHSDPSIAPLIKELFSLYKNETSVSRGTRNIAPYLFIGRERRGYFNFSRTKSVALVYAYTGPKEYLPVIAAEFHSYCTDNNLEFNMFSDRPIEAVGDTVMSSTPFGVVQRIHNLKAFTLEGGAMRRLRYQVRKFEKSGKCWTEEYQNGADHKIDQAIGDVIDKWCEARTMVNPLIYTVKDEILRGELATDHRLFLTFKDNTLQNVILISSMSSEENGYLMDLEFYSKDMPLGGLEYAIVNIIETLVAEGSDMLSLGGTYGCKLTNSPNADPQVDQLLDELREKHVFNDEGNLQFKNKFRPENTTIYLCRPVEDSDPDNVIDIIMMIADPNKVNDDNEWLETSDKQSEVAKVESVTTIKKQEIVTANNLVIEHLQWSDNLAECGYNPIRIPDQKVLVDLKTDSWAQISLPFITEDKEHLRAQMQQQIDLDQSLKSIFPFEYFVMTRSGREAENVLCRAWEKKGVVLQNVLFPTWIFNQIDNDFTPRELPDSSIYNLDSTDVYKGNINWELLNQEIECNAIQIAFVCVELNNNAAGGHPVSVNHIRRLKQLLESYSISLVVDATRVLENAQAVIENDEVYAKKSIWNVAKEILSYADVITVSLAKDFCVDRGGLIATRDEQLYQKFLDVVESTGAGIDIIDKKLVALSLQRKERIERLVLRRMTAVKTIWESLKANGVPVVSPVGTHCVLIDVKKVDPFSGFKNPVSSFVAWVYLNTGIRVSEHSVGMQKDTEINNLVRIAVPLGLKQEDARLVADEIVRIFKGKENIPELMPAKENDLHGKPFSKYSIIRYHNNSGSVIQKECIEVAGKGETVNHIVEESTVEGVSDKAPVTPHENDINCGSKLSAATFREGSENFPQCDIAVIGMAGRYPKAENLREFWNNLVQGKSCIDDIPDERFHRRRQNRRNQKYRGGFIEDIDKFDSLFFNISPREAETLDPQERLFLEVAWETIEDAGYYPEVLVSEKEPRNIGVYVGGVWTTYQSIGSEERLLGHEVIANSFLWSIANRVSYYMNLCGPSMAVDTACSSSLTAVYLACEAIYKGECASAIVGGVNLDVHQGKQEITVAGGLLSEDGLCRAFGKGANGYVPGEGVGAILIKPLAKALEDGDNIQGVIKSVAINHGGRTSGYSVPNPKAQTDLILSALSKAKIDARSIGYIEAHGTGTELGDPIEITGLTNAFQACGVDSATCAIGSVKSNIGHLEAAAGIVGICKVLLQMRNRQLVPSLHSSELNEFIDFENTPFYVQQELKQWNPKKVEGNRFSLRAGVSSFGAGGSNAHIILENYNSIENLQEDNINYQNLIFPISAKNENQLTEAARKLYRFLVEDVDVLSNPGSIDIKDVAYTLQIGRKSFDFRLAVIADNSKNLIERLKSFIDGGKDENILSGTVKNSESITKVLNRREKEEFVQLISQGRDAHKIAQLWTDGLLADWQGFKNFTAGKRISLPTYPFADKRHWIASGSDLSVRGTGSSNGIHPLIDSNESTFERQLFRKEFTEDDFFIYDHLVSDIPTLPGVAYLDLARKAGEVAAGRKVQRIKNILWVSPLTVNNSVPTEAFIELKANRESVSFEVFSELEGGIRRLYSQGKLDYSTQENIDAKPEYVDIDSIRSRCIKVIEGRKAYPLFKSLGLDLGPSFQALKEVYRNSDQNGRFEVLGVLNIPEIKDRKFEEFILHPSLVDASFQAAMAARLATTPDEMYVPYSLGEVEILHPLTKHCYSYITETDDGKSSSNLSKMNVLILDEHGKVLVKVRESVGVPLTDVHEKPSAKSSVDNYSKLYYSHVWKNVETETVPVKLSNDDSIVIFDGADREERIHNDELDGVSIVRVINGENFEALSESTYRLNAGSRNDYSQLLQSLDLESESTLKICYAWPKFHGSDDYGSIRESLEIAVYAFLLLCQALIEKKIDKVQLIYLYSRRSYEQQSHYEAINGFIKCLHLEHPNISCKTLDVDGSYACLNDLMQVVLQEFRSGVEDVLPVSYRQGERFVRMLENFDLSDSINGSYDLSPEINGIKHKGTYLITGGAGGLGFIFAHYLAKEYQAKLVLVGRSPIDEDLKSKLESLEAMGSETSYQSVDIADRNQVMELIDGTRRKYGQINGVIHSAGVLRDSYIRNKTVEEMDAVFSPKIYGTVNLDEATKDESLDFFVTFSSMAAAGGNMGQCDYSFANHFMDSYIHRRDLLRNQGSRFGKSLSLNWSIWSDGGMKLDEKMELFFKQSLGIRPLSIDTGIEAFTKGLLSDRSHFVVVEGQQEKMEVAWGLRKKTPSNNMKVSTRAPEEAVGSSISSSSFDSDDLDLSRLVQQELIHIVMEFLKMDEEDVDIDRILLDLGFDSISLTTYANALNERYKTDITPVLFFEYPSIREITKYLTIEHKDEAAQFHNISDVSSEDTTFLPSDQGPTERETNHISSNILFKTKKGWDPSLLDSGTNSLSLERGISPNKRFVERPIAIVGMSGVMPKSKDLEEFWENLKNETNMITEIPEDRWKWEEYLGDPLKEKNKSNSKWGGFIQEVDKFDPLFFGISPREAEMMDPQQRIFLETVWKTVEDAGHKVADLAGTKTGLFVGAATNDYTDLMNSLGIGLDGYTASGNSHAVLVNRVSFLLDLRGPSAPLDTACSSSLIAVHRAVESIHTGSSDMAIVGGVQVMLTPAAYISFGMAGMLSDDGKCKTFDKSADGYVRGEGVGAILLKPLEMAEADGNHIYALIKSTAENHGGKVTMLTAPNPNAQSDLLIEAYEKAHVDPATIGYIECHGTGTSLGDPIEIQALTRAFSELYKRQGKSPEQIPHCGLSSVKTNIGHLETAAGIAGILKVLLSIKNKQIPANLHFEELNPYINLNNPFYVVDKTKFWESPTDSSGSTLPRRAGISSFGFGGANAHIVLEEYLEKEQSVVSKDDPKIFILSAKNDDRLKAYATLMNDYLEKNQTNIDDFIYTLQVGRDPMEQRLGFVGNSIDDIKSKLRSFIYDNDEIDGIYQGRVDRKKLNKLESLDIDHLIDTKDYRGLISAWIEGYIPDWSRLYGSVRPKRISLPTYPFARERYWFGLPENEKGPSSTLGSPVVVNTVLHPLLHTNNSKLNQQVYTSVFNGKEFFLSSYQILDQTGSLPISALLEMVCAATENSALLQKMNETVELHHVEWFMSSAPIENRPVNIELVGNSSGRIDFEVYGSSCIEQDIRGIKIDEDIQDDHILCQGSARICEYSENPQIDLSQLKEYFSSGLLESENIYNNLENRDLRYGNALRGVERLYRGDDQVLAVLSLPESQKDSFREYGLHPSMLEGVLQASADLIITKFQCSGRALLPEKLEYFRMTSPCSETMYTWIRLSRKSNLSKKICRLDVDMIDISGSICVTIKSLEYRLDHALSPEEHQKNTFTALIEKINSHEGRLSKFDLEESSTKIFEDILANIN